MRPGGAGAGSAMASGMAIARAGIERRDRVAVRNPRWSFILAVGCGCGWG